MTKTKEVAVATEEPKALVVAGEINYEADIADAPQFTKDEAALPFLRMVQKTSPQIEEGHALYLAHAKPGQLLATVSGETFDAFGENAAGVEAVVVYGETTYDEWIPRDSGGGFVKTHGTNLNPAEEAALLKQTTKGGPRGKTDVFANGNELVKTVRRVVMMRTPQGLKPMALNMKSTELKKSRAWNALINDFKVQRPDGSWFNPAIYAAAYRLKTIREEGDGNSWFNWSISSAGPVTPTEYIAARDFSKLVKTGAVKIAVDEDTPAPSREGNVLDDQEVPF